MSPVADTVSIATGLLVMLGVPAYCVLQIWAPMKLSAGWRSAALAPLLLTVPLLIWCSYAFADQSNLWPLPFILFGPFGAAYLALVVVIGRRRTAV